MAHYRKKFSLLLSLGVVFLLLSTEVQATRVMAIPLKQMAIDSDIVVYARVGHQQLQWDKTHSRVLTLTTIEVIDVVKGAQKGDVLTIYQVGGSLDGVTYKIPGALRFVPGEQMVFFAERYQDMIVSYGMGLGKYRVSDAGGHKTVMPEYGDVAFVQRGPEGEFVPAPRPDNKVQNLADFLRELRKIIRMGGVQ